MGLIITLTDSNINNKEILVILSFYVEKFQCYLIVIITYIMIPLQKGEVNYWTIYRFNKTGIERLKAVMTKGKDKYIKHN